MKVKDLIHYLQQEPQDVEVIIETEDGSYCEIEAIREYSETGVHLIAS